VSSLEDTAHQLYAVAPGDFTTERNRRAKEAREAGDAQLAERIQKLRKPTTAAWLLNTLVRTHREEVDQVLALGAELRAAQGVLSGDEVRALDRSRRQLTRAVTEQARALGRQAGHPVSEQVAGAVEETLRAAMADAAAAAALSTGLLTDTFSSTGLDPVAVDGVVAVSAALPVGDAAAPALRRPSPDRRTGPDPTEVTAARADLENTVGELEQARRRADEARDVATAVHRHREALEVRRRELEQQLADVQHGLGEVRDAERAAGRAVESAARDERAAATALQRAQDRLGRLG
jgi:hypothetical protein